MTHNIRVAFLGEDAVVAPVVTAVLEKKIIPAANVFLPKAYREICPSAAVEGATFCAAVNDAVVNGEVVVVAAHRQEFSSELSPICGCTTGRIVLAISDDQRIDCDYVLERVAKGTQVVAAPVITDENGQRSTTPTFSTGFPVWMKRPCLDILAGICQVSER